MTELELIELLREYHDNRMLMSFNSLLNTLMLCDKIYKFIVDDETYYWNNIKQPTYLINLYEKDKKVDHLGVKHRHNIANLWIGFEDENNVYIMQYFSFNKEEDEFNIDRNSRELSDIKTIKRGINIINWTRKDE